MSTLEILLLVLAIFGGVDLAGIGLGLTRAGLRRDGGQSGAEGNAAFGRARARP